MAAEKVQFPNRKLAVCVVFFFLVVDVDVVVVVGKMLTIKANPSNLESKLLVAVAKVCRCHIYNREQLCRRGVDF